MQHDRADEPAVSMMTGRATTRGRRDRTYLRWGRTLRRVTDRYGTIRTLPNVSFDSTRRCASAISASEKLLSTTGRSVPSPSAAPSSRENAAVAVAFSAVLRARRTVPMIETRLERILLKSNEALAPA